MLFVFVSYAQSDSSEIKIINLDTLTILNEKGDSIASSVVTLNFNDFKDQGKTTPPDKFNWINALITLVIGVLGPILFFVFRRKIKAYYEVKLLFNELSDVKRHLIANKFWISEIRKEKSAAKPLDFYLVRLYCWDDLIFMSHETYRYVPVKAIQILAHARLRVRNIDIEIKSFINYLKEDKLSSNVREDFWKFLYERHEFLVDWLQLTITYLTEINYPLLYIWDRKSDKRLIEWENKEKQIGRPTNILRETCIVDSMNSLNIKNKDSEEIALKNFINMPPYSKANQLGANILHMNTRTAPYEQNDSAKEFINSIKLLNPNLNEFLNDSSTLKFAVETALERNKTGLFLEFGFCSGVSINFIAALAYDRLVYGFDSLQGLKTTWRTNFDANVFAYKDISKFPFIPLANVSLVIGWIEDTLPVFKNEYLVEETVAFINIDSDSFHSAKTILNNLKDKILPGKTVIYLDEGYNFSDPINGHAEWKKHEYLALNQFAEQNNLTINYLACNRNHQQLVVILENKDD